MEQEQNPQGNDQFTPAHSDSNLKRKSEDKKTIEDAPAPGEESAP